MAVLRTHCITAFCAAFFTDVDGHCKSRRFSYPTAEDIPLVSFYFKHRDAGVLYVLLKYGREVDIRMFVQVIDDVTVIHRLMVKPFIEPPQSGTPGFVVVDDGSDHVMQYTSFHVHIS